MSEQKPASPRGEGMNELTTGDIIAIMWMGAVFLILIIDAIKD